LKFTLYNWSYSPNPHKRLIFVFDIPIEIFDEVAMDWDEQRLGRRLKLRDLHVLLVVAECGSMGKAADRLSVSQPAISKIISDMEYALGVPLLDRNPRGVEPTVYARALLDGGVVVFDQLKQAIKRVEFLANPGTGELWIGSTIAIAAGFIPAVIDRMSQQYPRMVFHLSAGEASTTYRALEERKVDLVISPIFAPIDENIHTEVLYNEPLVVIAGSQSTWARRRRLELAELASATWTLPPPSSLTGSVVVEAFRAQGLDLPGATVFTSVTPVRNALVATGRYLSLAQGSVARFSRDNPGFKVLPIDLPTTRRPIAVITLKNRTLSPNAQLFINCAHEVAKALARRN
jgi:DNA-binding transcriptional LysR family regulator